MSPLRERKHTYYEACYAAGWMPTRWRTEARRMARESRRQRAWWLRERGRAGRWGWPRPLEVS